MVHISAPTLRVDGDDTLVEAKVTTAGSTRTMWFRVPSAYAPDEAGAADAYFPVGLALAMATDQRLELDAPVSHRLLAQHGSIQDMLTMWHPSKLSRAAVDAPSRTPDPAPPADGVAACFTGGVDSFFTLVKNEDRITSLVYAHGFDIPLTRTEIREVTSAHLRSVAADSGRELIELSTNLKSFLDPHIKWGPIAHGPGLASIGMLLSRRHGTLLIPATHTYADLFPWGSHPLLDPLWSTDAVSFVHDGAEATRVQKTIRISDSVTAQQHLRVCWKNTGAYNCGVCEKCYRTKTCLRLAGKLDRFTTFAPDFDLDVVRNMKIANANSLAFAEENLAFAREVGDEAVADALGAAVAAYYGRHPGHAEAARLRRDVARLNRKVEQLRGKLEVMNNRKAVRFANAVGGLRPKTSRK